MRIRQEYIALASIGAGAVIALAPIPALAAGGGSPAQKGATPPGNNGTIKIDQIGLDPGDQGGHDNDPHVSCGFDLQVFGYDLGTQTLVADYTAQAPSGHGEAVQPTQGRSTFTFQGTGAGNDLDHTEFYKLNVTGLKEQPQQGYHIKLTVHVTGSQGSDVKHKVFWYEPCAPTPAPSQSSAPAVTPTLTPTSTPTQTPTEKPGGKPTKTPTSQPTLPVSATSSSVPVSTPATTAPGVTGQQGGGAQTGGQTGGGESAGGESAGGVLSTGGVQHVPTVVKGEKLTKPGARKPTTTTTTTTGVLGTNNTRTGVRYPAVVEAGTGGLLPQPHQGPALALFESVGAGLMLLGLGVYPWRRHRPRHRANAAS